MRLTVEQSALQKATARAASVVSRNNTIPILNNLLIEAGRGGAWIVGTDLDRSIRARVEATVDVEGQITVPAASFAEIARNAPKGAEISLAMQADDPRLQVRFGRSRYQLPVLPAGDFPVQGGGSEAVELTVPAAELATLIARTHFAQSTEETRYILNGTRLETIAVDGVPMLRMVATDGHRLALDETAAPAGVVTQAVTIPRQTIGEMRRLLEGVAGPVALQISPAFVALETDEVRLISKVIDGTFPDYNRVIPRSWRHEAEIDRKVLAEAVKRVALISAEKVRAIKLTLDPGVMTLSLRNMESGAASEEIEIDYDGPQVEIGFNAKYILDTLDQTSSRTVVFRVINGVDAARLDPHRSDSTATGTLCVLMPLRV